MAMQGSGFDVVVICHMCSCIVAVGAVRRGVMAGCAVGCGALGGRGKWEGLLEGVVGG